MNEKLTLKFDPNTIEHLGVSLYSKLPSVLSELISNSWDADAENIKINFYENATEKSIEYIDDGEGMTFDELNEKFLLIGRNRRTFPDQVETSKGRKVIGKKGLGKLAVFGICDEIEITSTKNGYMNKFQMELGKIKGSKGEYNPTLLIPKNTPAEQGETNGIIIALKKIRRKTGFNLEEISISISKKFVILDQIDLNLSLNEGHPIRVTNELKFKALEEQFRWNFPITDEYSYKYSDQIRGFIFTTKTPISDTELSGIYLTSRGKIVNTASFYGLRDNDHFHSYVTGYLEIDFIDDFPNDVISTDRQSLNWETDETRDLQKYIQHIIRRIGNEWKKKRAELKRKDIKELTNLNIDEWQNGLVKYERELSERIINPILTNSSIDTAKSSEIIKNVIDKFDNKTYKEYADKISQISNSEQLPDFLKLIDDWKAIESKQFRDLAHSRIEVIKQFEEYLNTDTKEVPTLHNFFKKFSWLLDPRILEFKDEVRYSSILKETFPEKTLGERDRRIDFLCSNALGEILYVIEIKRSTYEIDEKALEQAYNYQAFLKAHYASTTGFSNVVCFVVGGKKTDDYKFKSKEKTYINTGEVFAKTYVELLEQSKEYHKEFIDAYDEHNL
jgi:hypothetical protein